MWEKTFGTLLADFPDPIVVTDSRRAVVFLNCAAKKLFGEALNPGDVCPLCGETPLLSGTGENFPRLAQCPTVGESLKAVPVLLKSRWPVGAPLSLTATPIRGA
ncbi:MAG TPA: hypothetical protein VE082_00805, partial [Desulfobaccales bacterium]|nr:hypothetical protein [Desulfobaccales bacterium]